MCVCLVLFACAHCIPRPLYRSRAAPEGGERTGVSVDRGGAGGRARFVLAPPQTFWAIPYIMISWFIAVLMLRFGRRFFALSYEKS